MVVNLFFYVEKEFHDPSLLQVYLHGNGVMKLNLIGGPETQLQIFEEKLKVGALTGLQTISFFNFKFHLFYL